MALVLDTGPIVAALNRGDPNHRRCAAMLAGGEDFVVPGPVLVEVDYWLGKLVGPQAWAAFVDDVITGAYRVIHPSEADLTPGRRAGACLRRPPSRPRRCDGGRPL